jgi:hypothetical protein
VLVFFTLDQGVGQHYLLHEALLTTQSWEDSNNAEALNEMEFFCTFQEHINNLGFKLEDVYNF